MLIRIICIRRKPSNICQVLLKIAVMPPSDLCTTTVGTFSAKAPKDKTVNPMNNTNFFIVLLFLSLMFDLFLFVGCPLFAEATVACLR